MNATKQSAAIYMHMCSISNIPAFLMQELILFRRPVKYGHGKIWVVDALA